jgi:hypothetical protein
MILKDWLWLLRSSKQIIKLTCSTPNYIPSSLTRKLMSPQSIEQSLSWFRRVSQLLIAMLIVICLTLVSGCSSQPLVVPYPTPPALLTVQPQVLPQIQPNESGVVTESMLIMYTHNIIHQYNLLRVQTTGLIQWVHSVGTIHNDK